MTAHELDQAPARPLSALVAIAVLAAAARAADDGGVPLCEQQRPALGTD